MKKSTALITVIASVLLFVSATFAKTSSEWERDLAQHRADLRHVTSELAALEPQLAQKEKELTDARTRYTAAHDAWKGLNYRFHNIDAGYAFDEASLVRARAKSIETQVKLAKLLGELGDATQRREIASRALDEAKKYQLDGRPDFGAIYEKADRIFSGVNDAYWKISTEEKVTRTLIVHWENVAIQIEDKVAEVAFSRLRDETMKLRVQVQGLKMRQKHLADLAEAVSALLK